MLESSLCYLQESMSNYMGNPICQSILAKLQYKDYHNEEAFITELDDREISYLNALVRQEMRYASSAEDRTRLSGLNNIYELLY